MVDVDEGVIEKELRFLINGNNITHLIHVRVYK
jgi:hypothetical protein